MATLDTTGEVDVVEAFTTRMPIEAISAVLGLPADRRPWLLDTSREIGGMLEPLTPFDPASMSQRFAELDTYFRDLISQRRHEPGHDLISALAAADDGPALHDDEIVGMIGFLLFAGHETVTGMLGNALVALAVHPEQRALLRARPDLTANAVEELLRFDPPAQVSARQATADFIVAGVTIKRGERLLSRALHYSAFCSQPDPPVGVTERAPPRRAGGAPKRRLDGTRDGLSACCREHAARPYSAIGATVAADRQLLVDEPIGVVHGNAWPAGAPEHRRQDIR